MRGGNEALAKGSYTQESAQVIHSLYTALNLYNARFLLVFLT